MPDLRASLDHRPTLATSLIKLAQRTRRRGPLEVLKLGIDRAAEEFFSESALIMFCADPLGIEPREVPGAVTRRAAPDDGEAYARDIGTDTAATFRARLSDATGCYLVELDDRLVHASWVTATGSWAREVRAYIRPPAGHCYIYESWTSPDVRGRGIYPFALGGIGADAVRKGWKLMWVAVENDNEGSVKAVTKAGFQPSFTIGTIRRFGRVEVRVPKDLPGPAPTIDTGR